MKLLLDTHIAVHFISEPERIAPAAYDLIMASAGMAYVSAVSIWEIAIKFPMQRKHGAMPFSSRAAIYAFREAGFEMLDITPAHAAAVEDLPPIHADPFDRLLVAQALTEPMRLVTADRIVARYSDIVILA
jgi:PIN domain nuclease of toxin-antitoxin system